MDQVKIERGDAIQWRLIFGTVNENEIIFFIGYVRISYAPEERVSVFNRVTQLKRDIFTVLRRQKLSGHLEPFGMFFHRGDMSGYARLFFVFPQCVCNDQRRNTSATFEDFDRSRFSYR